MLRGACDTRPTGIKGWTAKGCGLLKTTTKVGQSPRRHVEDLQLVLHEVEVAESYHFLQKNGLTNLAVSSFLTGLMIFAVTILFLQSQKVPGMFKKIMGDTQKGRCEKVVKILFFQMLAQGYRLQTSRYLYYKLILYLYYKLDVTRGLTRKIQ